MKKDHGYLVLDMRTGLMDGTFTYMAHPTIDAAEDALEYFAETYPAGMWVLVKRMAYCGERYPGIPDYSWAFKRAPEFYGVKTDV